jgi:flagellar FliJ protein
VGKFSFRLASVLRLRESVRDEKRSKLADAYAALQKLEDRRAEIVEESRELSRWQKSSADGGRVDVDRILDAQRYQSILQTDLEVVDRQKSAVEIETEKRRVALIAADQDVKVLEKLRQSQLERHKLQLAAAEMKQLDEVAGRKTNRQEVT